MGEPWSCAKRPIQLISDLTYCRMDDGYHEVLTVMQSVSLCDEIRLRSQAGDNYREHQPQISP